MTFLAIIPNYWARHEDPQIALHLAKKISGELLKKKVPYRIYKVEDPEAYCNEVDGSICHKRGTKVELYEKYDPPPKKK